MRTMIASVRDSAEHVGSSSLEKTNSSQNLATVAQDTGGINRGDQFGDGGDQGHHRLGVGKRQATGR